MLPFSTLNFFPLHVSDDKTKFVFIFYYFFSCVGCQTKAMWDSTSNSESLTGEPTITSAPPLILLQSEDRGGDQGKLSDADGATAGVQETSESAAADTSTPCPPPPPSQSLVPSSHSWSSAEGPSCASTTPPLPDEWNLDQVLSEVGLALESA